MKKIIQRHKKYGFLVFLLLVVSLSLGSCFRLDPPGPSVVVRASLKSDEQKKEEKDARVRRNRENIQSRYYARDREDTCSTDTNCRDDCDELYDADHGAYDECLKLKKTVVEDMKDIIRLLEDPSIGELINLESDVFTVLMALSVEPWIRVLRRSNRAESEVILSWIARNRDISEAVHDYGSSGGYTFEIYEGLRELLASAGGGDGECTRLENGLTANLNDSSFNFCSIARREENEYVILIVEGLQKAFECDSWSFDLETEPCSISLATAIEEILTNPTDEALRLIQPTELDAYLRNVTCSGGCWPTNQYGARRVLRWIASTPVITEVFRDLDTEGNTGNFRFLKFLLGKLHDSDYKEALSQSLDNGKSFIENAIPYQNQEALEWVHDFFARGSLCSSPTDYLCIFKQYCALEWSSNPLWESLLALENFNNFIERILHDEQPNNRYPDWWETKQQCTVRIRNCEGKCDNKYGDGCAGEVGGCQSACETTADSCKSDLSGCKGECNTDGGTCVENCGEDSDCKAGCTGTLKSCKESCESKIERCDSKQEECNEQCDSKQEECDDKQAECREACQVPVGGCQYLSAEDLQRDEIQWMCRNCDKTSCICDSDNYCPYPPL